MTTVKRTTRDGHERTTDAVRPLLEGVQKLEASLDRAAKQIEDARRAEAEKQLNALVDGAVRNIYAEIAQADRQQEDAAFERRLFGERFPGMFCENNGLFEESK